MLSFERRLNKTLESINIKNCVRDSNVNPAVFSLFRCFNEFEQEIIKREYEELQ